MFVHNNEIYDVGVDPMQTDKSYEVDARHIISYTKRHYGLVRNPREAGWQTSWMMYI